MVGLVVDVDVLESCACFTERMGEGVKGDGESQPMQASLHATSAADFMAKCMELTQLGYLYGSTAWANVCSFWEIWLDDWMLSEVEQMDWRCTLQLMIHALTYLYSSVCAGLAHILDNLGPELDALGSRKGYSRSHGLGPR
jgi:hypothetical protein